MTKVYAFVLALLILTLTSATAWGQTSGGPETVLIHSGSATLHAVLWRPQGRGPFPGILLNHGSGRTRDRGRPRGRAGLAGECRRHHRHATGYE